MQDLMRELEDDLRREQLLRLWNKVGKALVGISLAVIAGTAVTVAIRNHERNVAMEKTSYLLAGVQDIDQQNYKAALASLQPLAQDETSPYYGIALLYQAKAQEASGDKEGAAQSYLKLAAQHSVFSQIASGAASKEPDSASPFYYTQSEEAAWQLLQDGKKDDAITKLLALYQDSKAPYSMRERLGLALHHLAPEKLTQNTTETKGQDHE